LCKLDGYSKSLPAISTALYVALAWKNLPNFAFLAARSTALEPIAYAGIPNYNLVIRGLGVGTV